MHTEVSPSAADAGRPGPAQTASLGRRGRLRALHECRQVSGESTQPGRGRRNVRVGMGGGRVLSHHALDAKEGRAPPPGKQRRCAFQKPAALM